jgi:hypothetical protein
LCTIDEYQILSLFMHSVPTAAGGVSADGVRWQAMRDADGNLFYMSSTGVRSNVMPEFVSRTPSPAQPYQHISVEKPRTGQQQTQQQQQQPASQALPARPTAQQQQQQQQQQLARQNSIANRPPAPAPAPVPASSAQQPLSPRQPNTPTQQQAQQNSQYQNIVTEPEHSQRPRAIRHSGWYR